MICKQTYKLVDVLRVIHYGTKWYLFKWALTDGMLEWSRHKKNAVLQCFFFHKRYDMAPFCDWLQISPLVLQKIKNAIAQQIECLC